MVFLHISIFCDTTRCNVGDDYQCFEEFDVKFDFGGQLVAKTGELY